MSSYNGIDFRLAYIFIPVFIFLSLYSLNLHETRFIQTLDLRAANGDDQFTIEMQNISKYIPRNETVAITNGLPQVTYFSDRRIFVPYVYPYILETNYKNINNMTYDEGQIMIKAMTPSEMRNILVEVLKKNNITYLLVFEGRGSDVPELNVVINRFQIDNITTNFTEIERFSTKVYKMRLFKLRETNGQI